MTWFSEHPTLPARRVSDVLSEIVEVIGKAARPAGRGSHDLWSRAGEVAKEVRSRAGEVAHELAPYGRAGGDFARRHGVTLGAIGGAVAVGVIAYYFLRAADRAPRRKPQHNPSLARHFPSA
jgi:hypothetical protein